MTPTSPQLLRLRSSRVLVTGATGFKGAWLCSWLLDLGADVHALSLAPPTSPSLFTQAGLADRVAWMQGDVRDPVVVTSALTRTRPHVVIHLAAQALVRPSYVDPIATFGTNVMGTAHLLEAIRTARRACGVVIVSTDKCYQPHSTPTAHREGDPLGGHDPYSASKACTELVTDSYRRSFFPPDQLGQHGIAIASARAGNVIGPGDHAPERLVPDCIRALEADCSVALRNPSAVRPWQHVLEPLAGYLELAGRLHPLAPTSERVGACGAWNLGPRPEDAVTVRELVTQLMRVWGDGQWTHEPTAGAPEAPALRLAIDKALTQLSWRPTWTVQEAVRRTAAGYRRLGHLQSPDEVADWVALEIASYAADAGLTAPPRPMHLPPPQPHQEASWPTAAAAKG